MEYRFTHRSLASRFLFIMGTAMGISGATAAEPLHGYVLTAYSDAVGGEQLQAGHYSAALAKIRNSQSGTASTEVVMSTNACVAYAMLRKLREAAAACDAAVIAAAADRHHVKGVVSKSRIQEDSTVAVALSNRAVVLALSNEAVGSAEDLAEAFYLTPQSEFVVRNIAEFKRPLTGAAGLSIAVRRTED